MTDMSDLSEGSINEPKKSILLVEDNTVSRDIYTRMLSLLPHYHISTASDGADAVRLFKLAHANIDLVILDVDIPVLSGADTLRAMRVIEPHICCLAITAHIAPQHLDDMISQGISGLMRKPFRIDDLLAWTQKLLQTRPSEAVDPF